MTFSISSFINLLVFLIPSAAITLPHSIGIGTGLLFLIGLFVLARDRVISPLDTTEKRLLMAFGLFAAVSLLSILWFGDKFSEFDTPSRFILAIPVYLLLRRFPPSQGAFWFGMAVGAMGGGLIAMHRQFILGIPFDDIRYMHHIRFGDISLVLGGISAAGLPYFRRFRRGYLIPLFAFGLGIIGSIISGARGGWPAIPILLYCLHRQNFQSLKDVPQRVKTALVLASILAATLFSYGGGHERATAAISDIRQYQAGYRGTSVGTRFELWKASAHIFLNHPILGVGHTRFIVATQEMVSTNMIDKTATEHDHAHNDFLDILAKQGLLGLIALLLIFIYPARVFTLAIQQGNASQKTFGMAGLILIVCFSVFCLTETMFLLTLPTTFYVFTVAALSAFISNSA
jgi:O-antigen ligase